MQCDLFDTVFLPETRAEIARPAPPRPDTATVRRKRRPSNTRAADATIISQLQTAHGEYDSTLFDGELGSIRIRISRRMKNRLGHYMVAGGGQPAEIAMSLRHLERDPWEDVLHTLAHEMVHQWQDQNGMALDHGQAFRAKAREVGISARATRPSAAAAQPRLAARAGRRRRP
ncbi:MAG TPA: SprT-like domain-containing protein [Gemmatimonadaceae bacterium]